MRSLFETEIRIANLGVKVKGFSSRSEFEASFNNLCPNGHRISYKKVCSVEGNEVAFTDLQSGYKVGEDYIILSKELRNSLKSEKSPIQIEGFLSFEELYRAYGFTFADLRVLKEIYFLEPTLKSEYSYSLLFRSLIDNKKVAFGKFTIRSKERIVLILPFNKCLVLMTLFYPEELKEFPKVDLEAIKESDLNLMKELIGNLTIEEFSKEQLIDNYKIELEKLLKSVAKGEKIIVKSPQANLESQLSLAVSSTKKKAKKE